MPGFLKHFHTFIIFASVVTAQQKEYKAHIPTTLVYPPLRHAPIHKAGKLHLMAFMALIGRTDVKPDNPYGIAGVRLKSTDDPLNPHDDDDLTVYALNSGQNNIIYNSTMQTLDVYEGKTSFQKLSGPRGIAATPDGDVWITDTGNHRVVRLLNPGTYLQFVKAFGKKGSNTGEFDSPGGIAIDAAGQIYIADTGNDRIQIFDKDMTFQSLFGFQQDSAEIQSNIFQPDGLALTDGRFNDTYFGESFLIVMDMNHTRIRKYSLEGRFISGVNSTDYGYQRVYLTSAAIDYYCNIWVTDLLNHCVHKFDRYLNYITSFGHIGEDDNEFFEPRAIFIGKKFGQVFILDKHYGQYFHIGTDILNMNVSMADSMVQFEFLLTEQSRMSAWIENEQGQRIAELANNRIYPLGKIKILWDRLPDDRFLFHTKSLAGRYLQLNDSLGNKTHPDTSGIVSKQRDIHYLSGLYRFVIEAKTTYRYSRYFTKRTDVEFAVQ